MNLFNIIIAIFPLLIISIIGRIFPIKKNGFKPIFQPPNWVFSVIWPFLLISFGTISSLLINKIKYIYLFYFIILFILSIWLVFNYYNYYQLSFYCLLKGVFWTIIYVSYLFYLQLPYYAMFILFLLFWLIYASCLNAVIYQHYYYNLQLYNRP